MVDKIRNYLGTSRRADFLVCGGTKSEVKDFSALRAVVGHRVLRCYGWYVKQEKVCLVSLFTKVDV